MIDERADVSYPDMTQRADGLIYIVYDRERGAQYPKMRIPADEMAKEILFCTLREEDILAGRLVSDDARLEQIVSKLGK